MIHPVIHDECTQIARIVITDTVIIEMTTINAAMIDIAEAEVVAAATNEKGNVEI